MILWFFIVFIVLGVDLFSKFFISNTLELSETIAIIPGLNFTLSFNEGAAFGLLADAAGWQRWFFIIIATVLSAIIIRWRLYLKNTKRAESLALALILGGAWGNLFDRIYFGYVIDFIDVYYKSWHWYTFNIADSAICIGAVIIMSEFSFSRDEIKN